jgi:hypothetical protein
MAKNTEDIAIDVIDLQLYRYGLILDVDRNRYFDSGQKRIIQLIKYIGIRCFMSLNIMRLLFLILKANKGMVPVYYLDLSQYLGMLPQYARIDTLLSLLLANGIINLFNNGNKIYIQFFDIIKVLKGKKPKELIKIYDEKEMNKFARKVKFFKTLINYGVPIGDLTVTCLALYILVTGYYPLYVTEGILCVTLYLSMAYIIIMVCFNGFIYFFIVCYYCKIRLKIFNKILANSKLGEFLAKPSADEIINEINDICTDISKHNKFWRKYFGVLTFSLLPLNLTGIEQIVFSDMLTIAFIFVTMFCLGTLIGHYMLNLLAASVNKEANRSYKILFKFYVENNQYLNTNRKIKVKIVFSILLFWK